MGSMAASAMGLPLLWGYLFFITEARRITETRRNRMRELNFITSEIINSAITVHRKLGPGLNEKVYEAILARLLSEKSLHVERQKAISFDFDGQWFDNACRADLVVERSVVVEIKSCLQTTAVHEKQLLTYLRLLDCRVGLLINFGAALLRDGLTRIVNGPAPDIKIGDFTQIR
jgi:iron complex transport system substrate-binding protein